MIEIETEKREDNRLMSITNALLEAIKLKCTNVYNHSLMVGHVVSEVAVALGFDEEDRLTLNSAGLLHDFGKIAVRTDILLKPGELTVLEWEQMRLHPAMGKLSLEKIPGLERIAEIVVAHHEKDDGTGYPFRLIATEIPVESRLLRICDIYSAMIAPRAYKPAYPVQAVIDACLGNTEELLTYEYRKIKEVLEHCHVNSQDSCCFNGYIKDRQ